VTTTQAEQGAADQLSMAAFEVPRILEVYRLAVGAVINAALSGACHAAGAETADKAAASALRLAPKYGAYQRDPTQRLNAGIPALASAVIHRAMVGVLAAQEHPRSS
jgi:hypothetical protein